MKRHRVDFLSLYLLRCFRLTKTLRDTASEEATSSRSDASFVCALIRHECAAGCGAKSPRNFLNVLAKCSNPQYIYGVALYGGADVHVTCVHVYTLADISILTHVITPCDRELLRFAKVG